MINLENMRKYYVKYDSEREKIIQQSRDIIRKSKSCIGSAHRGNMQAASKFLAEMKKDLERLKETAKKNPKLMFEGIFKVAVQEYVEAKALIEFIKKGTIITYDKEFVDHEFYLLGLCDLGGELVRKAINSSINDDFKTAVKIREVLEQIYVEMSKFDFRNSELRKKYDGIKYDLKKLDDLVFQLKMKGSI